MVWIAVGATPKVSVRPPLTSLAGDPGRPCGPVSPVSPLAPVAPVSPLAPVMPVSPLAPVAPVSPLAPVSPFGPGISFAFSFAFTAGFRSFSIRDPSTTWLDATEFRFSGYVTPADTAAAVPPPSNATAATPTTATLPTRDAHTAAAFAFNFRFTLPPCCHRLWPIPEASGADLSHWYRLPACRLHHNLPSIECIASSRGC